MVYYDWLIQKFADQKNKACYDQTKKMTMSHPDDFTQLKTGVTKNAHDACMMEYIYTLHLFFNDQERFGKVFKFMAIVNNVILHTRQSTIFGQCVKRDESHMRTILQLFRDPPIMCFNLTSAEYTKLVGSNKFCPFDRVADSSDSFPKNMKGAKFATTNIGLIPYAPLVMLNIK